MKILKLLFTIILTLIILDVGKITTKSIIVHKNMSIIECLQSLGEPISIVVAIVVIVLIYRKEMSGEKWDK